MNQATVTQITEYLDKVAAKLGVGAQEIWPWFIKQQWVETLQLLTPSIPVLLFGVWIASKLKKVAREYDDKTITKSEKDTLEILYGFAAIVFLAAGGILLIMGVKEGFDLLNIEYAAFQDLVGMVK